tara:strand:- start:497 stop:718 length:222 start_codon:yes stop_codon:yes gene_type:complete
MRYDHFTEMTEDITREWLGEVWEGCPYIKNIYGELVLGKKAQERFDEILEMVQGLCKDFIAVDDPEIELEDDQ